mmetsp:Transcript_47128/g.102531  ORF Transcript_47128/g.102531 Transcript_47128/m.102531 type:complete len:750 (+) Transcript_47128:27-2276(+)|eukprot:CAMPEP_0204327460 /NCGR_PEP_ID=MMETSP0469-20131031/12583_1 /ASSEMBLY_ACC=CAM_ASM_000384 /TAXON_ID=2969 /ORGANISM="Oxyrrhis marina" /LENGTH=749 /DNA_ID=CAMNT_0051309679 /DNA_START=29 /DNA_END=2278 /DNA_ORIENTATION=-
MVHVLPSGTGGFRPPPGLDPPGQFGHWGTGAWQHWETQWCSPLQSPAIMHAHSHFLQQRTEVFRSLPFPLLHPARLEKIARCEGSPASTGRDRQTVRQVQHPVHAVPDSKDNTPRPPLLAPAAAVSEDSSFAQRLESLTRAAHDDTWKLCTELSDAARKAGDIQVAQAAIRAATKLKGDSPQVWLEAFKLHEEFGDLDGCTRICRRALKRCPNHEGLLLRLVKTLERVGDVDGVRSVLSTLQNAPVERTWKVLVEGACFEGRQGNLEVARSMLWALLDLLPAQGQIYCEAARWESQDSTEQALQIALRGAQACPKYAPVWQVVLREAERSRGVAAVGMFLDQALENVTSELFWKFHFEMAGAFLRTNNAHGCRKHLAAAAACCGSSVQWKVWLQAGRMEYSLGCEQACRVLLQRAMQEAPGRMKPSVLLEQCRLEEICGNMESAREMFAAAPSRPDCDSSEWKVHLEHVLLEIRSGTVANARKVADKALEDHPATGRIWAATILVDHIANVAEARRNFVKGVSEVPKSGEIWCEGARLYMNPASKGFNLVEARRSLEFAIHLTPQYGDSFLEMLRLILLERLCEYVKGHPAVVAARGARSASGGRALQCSELQYLLRATSNGCLEVLGEFQEEMTAVEGSDYAALEAVCSTAEPNYGLLWYWIKRSSWTVRQIFEHMAKVLVQETQADVLEKYVSAMLSRELGVPLGDDLSATGFFFGVGRLSRAFQNMGSLDRVERMRVVFGAEVLYV